jgi:hypothetical protein
MTAFVNDFMENFGPEVSKQLSSNLGISKKAASGIVPQVVPLILGGLKKQMETQGGSDRANHILNKYGSASVLDNIGELFSSKSQEESPDPRLGGLLGDSGLQASNMLADKFRLDGGTAMKIIPMLAPVILGALSHKRDKGGVGSSGIASLIDQDGDGQILDDVAGFLSGALGGSGSKKGGGILGGLLGSLFGKK